MSEGPTTAGSIVGKLKLDAAQWDADVAKAKTDAHQLGALEPTVKVDAKVGDALAKLEAVRAAEEKLGFSNERLRIAYQRLDEVQTRGGASESRLMSLHLAASQAEAAHEAAVRKLTAAKQSLADEDTKVEDGLKKTASAADNTSNSFNGLQGRTALIAAGIAALMAAPLAGFAVGVGGAMAAMGAAGTLALLGIGHEMAADTELGNQFQDNLATVKNDLHQLEATAAAGVITPFNQALAYLQPQMPRINQDMGAMAHWVGLIAATSVKTVVAGFEQLEPVLVVGAKVLADWANNMALFAGSTEFRQFIQYAVGQIPQVNSLLINLGGLVVHVVDAFMPLGTAVIPILSAIAYGFNAIPTPVLTGLASGAAAVGAAFLAWNYALQPLLSKMGILAGEEAAVAAGADTAAVAEGSAAAAATGWGAAMDFAMGPAGIVIGLVAALAGGLLAASSATDSATAAQVDFTAALQADNGAIREHVTLQAAKTLTDKGAYDAANQLGISSVLVTQAVLGQSGAYKTLTSELDGVIAKNTVGAAGYRVGARVMGEQGKAAQDLLSIIKSLRGTLSTQVETNKQFADSAAKAGDAASALAQDQNTLDDASKSADAATQGYIDALDKYAKSAGTAADKGAFLGASLVAMQGDWLSYDGALANAAFANYTLTQTFQDQGKEVSQGVKYLRDTEKAAIDLNTGLIDVTKSGAPALIQQLQGMQSAAEKAAAATYQHEVATKGAGKAAADAATIFKGDTYDALVADADQLGITAEQAKKLADRYFGLPSDVITKLQTEGQSTVVQTLDAIGQQLAELTGHPWTSTLDANGVPLSHEAYQAQLKLNSIKQINPADIKADAAKAHMTVDQFTQHLLSIPNKDTTITADTAAAEANVVAIQNHINALTGKVVTVTVQTNQVGAPVNTMVPTGTTRMYADGGTVIGPGGPKTDSVAAYLSVGEEVMPNPQAGRYRATLKALASDNPALAAATLGAGRSAPAGDVHVIVENKTGMNLADLIDIRVERANARTAASLRASKQKVAY